MKAGNEIVVSLYEFSNGSIVHGLKVLSTPTQPSWDELSNEPWTTMCSIFIFPMWTSADFSLATDECLRRAPFPFLLFHLISFEGQRDHTAKYGYDRQQDLCLLHPFFMVRLYCPRQFGGGQEAMPKRRQFDQRTKKISNKESQIISSRKSFFSYPSK